MASLVTLKELRTQAKQRADMENSNFLSDEEWNVNINKSAQELYDLLASAYSDYYFASYPIPTDGITDTYPLPEDFYSLLGVDQVISGDQAISLKPYNFQERNAFTKAAPSDSITIHYTPTMQKLERDSDTFDGINGWEEYIIVDAAIKAKVKEETDIAELALAKKDMKERLQAMISKRDSGKPERVTDIHQVDPFHSMAATLRYRLIGNNIKFVQGNAYGTVYE